MSLPKYDWEGLIDEMVIGMDEKGKQFSILGFSKERNLPYFELCRKWAASPKYRPIVANGSHGKTSLVREGNTSFSNVVFPQSDIRFIQIVKALASPIRFYIVRYLVGGPKSIAEFVTETQFAYYTSIAAFRHLERMGVLEVCGKTEGYNLYQLCKQETVRELLANLEALA